MALGSSAPEILLAVIETTTTLGECPGELGASTIVGSASFNLLVISAASIYGVTPENDTKADRDTTMPRGIKKIKDLWVFGVTATFSIFAYIWMWLVLRDQMVEMWEAILTFAFTFILLAIAYTADRCNPANHEEEDEEEADKPFISYSAAEIFKELIKEKQQGIKATEKEIEIRQKMKDFLKKSFGTDQIDNVTLE